MKAWVLGLGCVLFFSASCGDLSQNSSSRALRSEKFFTSDEVACPTGAGSAENIRQLEDTLKSRYGISIDLAPKKDEEKDKLNYEPISAQEMAVIEIYLKVAVDQLQKHPTEFFKAAQIKAFAYVKEPVVEGYPVAGLAMYDEGQLLFSVDTEDCAPEHIADTLHHEMFHFFHGNPDPPLFKDEEWAKLNPEGFKYNSSGDKDTEVNHPQPGFVSEYAMSEEGEDVAETFAAMMLGGTARLVKEWSINDAVLASKVAFVKNVMAKTSPVYSEAYWEKILQE